jgi:hypothetical protein
MLPRGRSAAIFSWPSWNSSSSMTDSSSWRHQSPSELRRARHYVRRILESEPDVRRRVLGPALPPAAVDEVLELSAQFTEDPAVRSAFIDKWNKLRSENHPIVQRCFEIYEGKEWVEMENEWMTIEGQPGEEEYEEGVLEWLKQWALGLGDWIAAWMGKDTEDNKEVKGPGYEPDRHNKSDAFGALFEAAGVTSILVMMAVVMIKLMR